MDGLADDDHLRARVVAVLGVGALPEASLRAALGDEWTAGERRDGLDILLQTDTSFSEVSTGYVHVPTVCEGTTWAVWVDVDDAADGFVRVHPSLSPFAWWLVDEDVDLVDVAGARLGALRTEDRVLDDADVDVVLGPEGWLDALARGWARVEVVDGAMRWSRIDAPPAPTDAQIAAVRTGFDHAIRHEALEAGDRGAPPDGRYAIDPAPVHEAMQVDRSAFVDAPIPPLTDLYVAAGLERRDSIVAVDGFDWPGLRAWQERNRIRLSYGIDGSQAEAAMALLRAFDDRHDHVSRAAAASALDDSHVAEVCWDLLHDWRDVEPDDLVAFGDILVAAAETSVGAAWWRARAVDRAGDTRTAVAALEAAVGPGCAHRPALLDLAGFRADRGDAPGALGLLQRAGVGGAGLDDDDVTDAEALRLEVEAFARHRPRPVARRNDQCPCGSGRKYKACHLGRETHSLDDRAAWLYEKAQRFLRDRDPDLTHDLAELVVDPDDDEDDDRFEQVAHGPFIGDVALHEAGVFAAFLAARHDLLPDDEALLASQWALTDRSIFEIVEVHRDGLRVRDLASGEVVTIVNVASDERARPGGLLVGRPLPVGATHRAFGGFLSLQPVHLDHMQAALDAGGVEDVTAAVAAVLRPPRLTNTDGHDLMLQTITWRVPDPSTVAAALAATALRADDADSWTLVRDSQNQPDTVIASVHLAGDELIAEVNSLERAMEMVDLVTAALPEAALVDVETHLPWKVPDAMSAAGASQLDVDDVDLDDPALRAAMAEITAQFERRWLDESIPALGGMTPRQAAIDPIGREQLHRLLASFPVPADDDVGSMNPDRLRAALDL